MGFGSLQVGSETRPTEKDTVKVKAIPRHESLRPLIHKGSVGTLSDSKELWTSRIKKERKS